MKPNANELLLVLLLALAGLPAATAIADVPVDPWAAADLSAQRAAPSLPGAAPRRQGQSLRSWQREQLTVVAASGAEVYVHAVQYEYTASGHLKAVWNNTGSGLELYWRADAANLRGQVTQETLGNGVVTFRSYDPVTGAVLGISSGQGANTHVQQLAIEWDLAGNVKLRRDVRAGHEETFLYDSLYRLTDASFTPLTTGVGTAQLTQYHYDGMGRFTSREDVGTYGYDLAPGANPYAVRSVTGRPGTTADAYFCYDDNGNVLTQRTGSSCTSGAIRRAFTWSAGNRLRTAHDAETSVTATFSYAASGARFRQVKTGGGLTETTRYIGAYYERVTATDGGTTTTKHRLYVRAGERVVAEEEILGSGVRETRYWHRDHLGSITAITTQAYDGGAYGVLGTTGFLSLHGYAAWGDPRNALTTAANPANWLNGNVGPDGVYHRGFTGHEMLPDLGIIHMNGRVYLPEIGRFLSPDPFVQFPESTQNYNRYVYVGNNPLSYSDPSGFFLKKLLGVVGFALNFVPGMQALSPFVRGFLTGMVGSGGNLKAGLLGGIGAAAFGGLHGMEKGIGKVLAHGMVGGALSVAGGGRFGDGFLGAATAQAFSGVIDKIGMNDDGTLNRSASARMARVMASAVVGGTAARLGGGKFGSGAITAAFSRMYNDEQIISDEQVDRRLADEKLNERISDAIDQIGYTRSTTPSWQNENLGSVIYDEGGEYSIGLPRPNVPTGRHRRLQDQLAVQSAIKDQAAIVVGRVPFQTGAHTRLNAGYWQNLASTTNTPVIVVHSIQSGGERYLFYPSGKWRSWP